MNPPSGIPESDNTPTYILAPGFAPDDGALPAGFLLDGRYEVLDARGGEGKSGMGIVYIVRDEDDTRYAAKTFQRRYARDLGFVQRFIREAKLWMQAGAHPNIVRVHRVDIIGAIPYIFMEYVETNKQQCLSLADHLAFGPMAMNMALDLAVQFCDGMAHATAAVPGLVHRDIKPENLLIDPAGVLKITDFGLVRAHTAPDISLQKLADRTGGHGSDPNLTGAGALMGTPAYMAPEQFAGADEVTAAADIYAFGCCLYEALTAFQPFRVRAKSTIERVMKLKSEHRQSPPPRLRERMTDAPPALEELLLRCLDKDPEKRWPNFAAMRDALEEIAAETGRPVSRRKIDDPSPSEVAVQMRSHTLLEGYERAIHLRALRESQEESPYAFHLVLASYFHHEQDLHETERQLCKAFRARETELGYEAARQLILLLLDQGRVSSAVQVMENFIDNSPSRRDHVLEAWVKLQCALGNCADAETCLDAMPRSLTTDALRLEIYRARKDRQGEHALAQEMLDASVADLREKIESLAPSSCVGWGKDGDADVLKSVMAVLCPQVDTSVLDVVDEAVWPDLRGYPDFAPDLAWLSEETGILAALSDEGNNERANFASLAELLDYPRRMRAHAARDEHWFWTQAAAMEQE